MQLIEKRKLEHGMGYIFETSDNYRVLSSDTKLYTADGKKSKWKIGVSLTSGCKVGCIYCFTNQMDKYRKLSDNEIVGQVDYIYNLPENRNNSYDKNKIEMKEMGDPAMNPCNTGRVIEKLNLKYDRLFYVVSTSGIKNTQLIEVLKSVRSRGADVRLQYSCHTTSDEDKRMLSPKLNMMSLEEIAETTHDWYDGSSRATLTFVPMQGLELSYEKVADLFVRDQVFVKISYLDMTPFVEQHGLKDEADKKVANFIRGLKKAGFTYAYRNGHHSIS